jgi:ABC-type polysaccharide/polyol phosphate export permease
LNWNIWIRQIHRWASIVFAAIVAIIFIMLGVGQAPANWVYLLPLFPLAILLFTGLYMFALPYAVRWRGGNAIRRQSQ